MPSETLSRDDLASLYLEQLPYEPYPVQEEALLAWFTSDEGVMVCAPTGMGKTLIAEAAAFEALHTRQVCYYTTPLIALTEQKFRELQASAVKWGFDPDDVGLVTGNRRVNPEARVLVVVAEILLNRLLHRDEFDFADVASVVMDEFHNFRDPERGMVWELSLGLTPPHARLLLLSATVGNTTEFLMWLRSTHHRKPQLVQSSDRKVPLEFHWVPDRLLNEQLQIMAEGDENNRRTPTLVFCFNRNQCWEVAEQMKGRHLITKEAQKEIAERLDRYRWNLGAGPKLKQLLLRGVGVHHAGLLPKYRRIVEEFFQKKLLRVCICTETLAAGINLPARSVVMPTLVKGPPGKKKLVDASSAHQIFGRAGRPQYDIRGYVYALAHEDDVKILRWREKYDQIPDDTPDPNLRRAKKKLKKKMPTRRANQQYWTEGQFRRLQQAPPGKLVSQGPVPWRLLAYLLKISPDVSQLRSFVRNRLVDPKHLERNQRELTRMLMTLWSAGYVTLEPEPPAPPAPPWEKQAEADAASDAPVATEPDTGVDEKPALGTLGALLQEANIGTTDDAKREGKKVSETDPGETSTPTRYEPDRAYPTSDLDKLFAFRGVNPLYGMFLLQHFDIADRDERIQAIESVLEIPGSAGPQTRPPRYEDLPPGPLAMNRLDSILLQRGLAMPSELVPPPPDEDHFVDFRDRPRILTLADKLQRLFNSELPGVHSLRIRSTWVVGELLRFGGHFDNYVRARDLVKQEGIIFRHLLRFILLCGEFLQVPPLSDDEGDWRTDLQDVVDQVTATCHEVDPQSTDLMIENASRLTDLVDGEAKAVESTPAPESNAPDEFADFGIGVDDDCPQSGQMPLPEP